MLVDPSEIKVKEGLERFRKDLGDIQDLALSIQKMGQIQPIVVNQNMELIAGGRRLAACALYSMKVDIKVIDETDDLAMREIEVEENVQRKDFSPAEQILAVKELHDIKSRLADRDATQHWGLQETADVLGTSKGNVSKDLALAELVEVFPELSKCKTKSELRSAGQSIMKLLDRAEGIEEFNNTIESTDQVEVSNTNATEFMKSLADDSVDILLCDPPYGIDIADKALGRAGETGGENYQGFKFDDSESTALSLIEDIACQSRRFCKETAHAYIFCAPEYFPDVYDIFSRNGWQPHIRPIIWAKVGQGQANMPDRWPSACYEMCLYARREKSKLIYTRPDVITANRVPPGDKVHPTQKPVDLLQDLITRSVRPGSTLVDPCMGSGSSLVAGIKEQMVVKGNDLHKGAYTAAIEYINTTLEVSDEADTPDADEQS